MALVKFWHLNIFILIVFSKTTYAKDYENLIEDVYMASDCISNADQFDETQWLPISNPRISYKNGTYWFKVVLKENTSSQNIVFSLQEPSIQSVTIYKGQQQIATKQSSLGSLYIKVPIKHNIQKEYYLKVNFKRQVNLPLKVYGEVDFHHFQTRNFLSIGLYYGLAIMVFLINIAFYISLSDKTFVFYALFLATINISFSAFDGVQYLIFSPQKVDTFIVLCHYFIAVFGALFASNFLKLEVNQPKADKMGKLFLAGNFFGYVLYFTTNQFMYCAIADAIGLSILAYYWFLGIISIKKDDLAIFFVIGYSMVLFSGIFYLVPLNFGISSISVSFNQLKLGALFEMLVLTYATSYRVKKLQEENEKYRVEIQKYMDNVFDLQLQLKSKVSKKQQEDLNVKIKKIKTTYELTDREVDVLIKITEGLSNKKIGEELFISLNTVKYHTRNIYEKMDIKKRTEITIKLLKDS